MIKLLSSFKALVLGVIDRSPTPFTRAANPDPANPSLEQIAEAAEAELHGFIKDGCFIQSGPLSDMGDACIWQGYYLAMCVHRWRFKKDKASHTEMLKAALALSKYVKDGVVYRGAMPTAFEGSLFHRDPSKVYYDDADGYTFRDDASLDSLLGFCFGVATANAFADDGTKQALSVAAKSLADKFKSNNYKLVKRDGKPTTHGNCTPGFFQAPSRILAACLPSLVSLESDWKVIAKKYCPEFKTPDTQVPTAPPWVNAHLGMLACLSYVTATKDGDPGRKEAIAGLVSLIKKYADAGNAFIVAASTVVPGLVTYAEIALANKILSEFSLGPKPQTPKATANTQPTPAWLRPRYDIMWQRDPYQQGSGEGPDVLLSRIDFLLPYYILAGKK